MHFSTLIRRTTAAWLVAAIAISSGCQAQTTAPATLQPASQELARKSIQLLSSDDMEGRGIGTNGLESAANYIASYFEGLGLKPPPEQKSYFDPFTYSTVKGVGPKTRLNNDQRAWKAGDDFNPLALSAEESFEGPVIFVGYGLATDKDKDGKPISYDDYAGADVRGKVALAMRFEPVDGTGKSRLTSDGWSDHASLITKSKLAASHGATALLVVHPPDHHGPEMLSPTNRTFGEALASIPVLHIKQHVAEHLLKTAGEGDLKSFQSAIDSGFAPRSVALKGVNVSGQVSLERNNYQLKNIHAYLPGKGKKAREFIVVGAHYDHLGRGGPGGFRGNQGQIHHGADDNASGTAAMLELARLLSQTAPLERSIIFIAFSGEEHGLLGSQHWVNKPPVPLKQIVAMVNMDMVGRVRNDTLLVGGTGTAAAFDDILKRADDASPLQFKATWRDGVAPSDNTSFVTKQIPVLFFFSGTHPDYHRPTDTADKINYSAHAEVINVAARVIKEIAASLGVVPEYGGEEGKGVKITGTSPGSAAAAAGLQANDVLIQFDQKKIETLYDLMDALNTATPGKPIKLKVLRDGKELTVDATPTERKPRD
jgi:hypothetical protein